MSTKSIQIQKNPKPTPGQPAVFSPSAVIANAGDNLTWHNADRQDHWPAPSATNPAGWVQVPIPPDASSRGDLALSTNTLSVTAATNANPLVLTLNGPAPPSGTKITIAYYEPTPPPESDSPWADLPDINKTNGVFAATKVSSNSCSIPVDSSTFGPFTPASGTLTVTLPLAYTLNYICALHPAETATITVNP